MDSIIPNALMKWNSAFATYMLTYYNHSIKHLGPKITAVRTPRTTNERLPAEHKERNHGFATEQFIECDSW